jgi:hypothetical protein
MEISINGRVLVGVSRAEYRRLTEGTSAAMERLRAQLEGAQTAHAAAIQVRDELKRSLDDALSAVERLSDERDRLREAHAKAMGDAAYWRAEWERDAGGSKTWTDTDLVTADVADRLTATAPVGSLVGELRATIVRQAREITRLKGESE